MGLQDREYHKEHIRKLERDAERRGPLSKARSGGPPDLPGGDWHWSLKALVWVALMLVLFLGFKAFEKPRTAKPTKPLVQPVAKQPTV